MYTLYLKIILSTFSTTPIALIKTNSEVEPAEINGSGKPAGALEPLNISYCIINFLISFKIFFFVCDSFIQKIFNHLNT